MALASKKVLVSSAVGFCALSFLIGLSLGKPAGASEKPTKKQQSFSVLKISMGSTGNPKREMSLGLVSNANYKNVVWSSPDGAKCIVDPWGMHEGDVRPFATFDCWYNGIRSSQTINCASHPSKELSLQTFFGGLDMYNQNFNIWCE